ncbi:MAG: hypothetical protein FWE57_06100 [Chitinispirillia bacterium]|nr:hypothetical protein [Chitinispirillia bacterium]
MLTYCGKFLKFGFVLTAAALFIYGCGSNEKVFLEIDYSGASEWQYLLGADIYGTAAEPGVDSVQTFSGSLRAYLHGLGSADEADSSAKLTDDNGVRFGLKDVTFMAPFLPEDEREDIYNRLSEMQIFICENNGISLSDTVGMPGVLSGGWDIMRSVARVMPALPNAHMAVKSSWEREQRFPLNTENGKGDVLLYQFFTLDSVYSNRGVKEAALSWAFNYRVALVGDGASSSRKYPLSGSGRGNAVLDVKQKKLLKSKANFQVTHSQNANVELNEIVHLEVVE